MPKSENSFFESLKTLFTRVFSGRIHFSKMYLGQVLAMDDGREYQIIRDHRVESNKHTKEDVAVFKVRFRFSGLPVKVNKRLSVVPAPFLMAKPGYREKIWCISEDGYMQGLYQWASKEIAEMYPQSFVFKLMTKRAAADSLTYEVIPETRLQDYIEKIIQ